MLAAAQQVDLTPLVYALVGLILAVTGVVTAFGKLILKRMDTIGKNTKQTNDTLNHKEVGDPTVKAQVDKNVELAQKTNEEVFAIKVEARDARKTAEAAQESAARAEKTAAETKLEVVEVKEIAKKLEGNSDTILGYFSRMGKRSDDPPLRLET